jgi:RNA polymerase sigma-70 factor (ECF subfamily)
MDHTMTPITIRDGHDAIVELLPDLRRFARALARSEDAADELVQTAYVHAFSHPQSLSIVKQPSNWMHCIIRNIWIDEKRSSHNRLSVQLTDDNHVADDDIERIVIARATLARVYTEVFALPEKLRCPIVLVCLDGLSYRETAARLNIPMGTLMSHLHRARIELARRIE